MTAGFPLPLVNPSRGSATADFTGDSREDFRLHRQIGVSLFWSPPTWPRPEHLHNLNECSNAAFPPAANMMAGTKRAD